MDADNLFLLMLSLVALGAGMVGGIIACFALVNAASVRKELGQLRALVELLQRRIREAPPVSPPIPTITAIPVQPAPPPETPPASVPPAPRPAAAPPPTAAPAFPRPVPPKPWPPSPSPAPAHSLGQLESRLGQQWAAWIGAIVVFFSVVFFLKYAFDNDWIGPTGQVVICAVVAAAMVTAGSRFIGQRWRILGQSLIGLGLAILYATFYAAFEVYHPPVMSQTAAFAFMVAVTAAGIALAVLHDAVSIAFLAVLGGVLTPVLVSTGQDSHNALFAYLLLLDLGVIGVAFFRGWRMLDALAMAGTFFLYAAWFGQFYRPELMAPALAWLGAFYLVFLLLPFLYHLVRRRAITVERFVMAVANAAFCAGFAWHILRAQYLFTMGFVALAMAATYVTLGAAVRRRLPGDARSLLGTIALSVTFLTLAVPMQLHAQGILLAWVAEAPVLAFLAYRYRYFPLRAFAAVVLLLGIGRLFFYHWPLHHEAFRPFFNRGFLSAMAVPIAAAALALVHQVHKNQATATDRAMKLAAALGGGLLALIIVHGELGQWLRHDYSGYAADAAVIALWAIGAIGYLLAGAKVAPGPAWGTGTFALFIAAILAASAFGLTLGHDHALFANARFDAALLVTAVMFAYAWFLHRATTGPGSVAGGGSRAFLVVGIVGLLVLLSTEVYCYCTDVIDDETLASRAAQMSITLVWSIYAATMLAIGFWKRQRPLRFGGLALFGIAAVKLVLVDLSFLKDIYRIISFLVLGMLMLAASYLYHRLEKRLATALAEPAPVGAPVGGGET